MELKKIIVQRLERLAERIRANIDAEGITASGTTRDSIKVVEYDGGVKVVSDGSGAPLTTLERGRAGGRVPQDFTGIIYQWSIDKGLSFDDERHRRRFAGAVAWGKIRKRGFGRPSPSDFGSIKDEIYTPEVSSEIEAIRDIIGAEVKKYIKNGIKSE